MRLAPEPHALALIRARAQESIAFHEEWGVTSDNSRYEQAVLALCDIAEAAARFLDLDYGYLPEATRAGPLQDLVAALARLENTE